jgi:hypothetical protein
MFCYITVVISFYICIENLIIASKAFLFDRVNMWLSYLFFFLGVLCGLASDKSFVRGEMVIFLLDKGE